MSKMERAAIRAEAFNEAATVLAPKGPRPCDCEHCDCGNPGDHARVVAWDEATASAAQILALAPAYGGECADALVAPSLTTDTVVAVGKAILPYLPSEVTPEALGAMSHDAAVALRRTQALAVPPDIVEASRRASRGDGFTSGPPWFRDDDMMLTGSPDKHAGHIIADFDLAGCRADDIPSDDGCGLSEPKDDARFAAMCWTFVRRIIAEQDAREMLL